MMADRTSDPAVIEHRLLDMIRGFAALHNERSFDENFGLSRIGCYARAEIVA